ncbi:MAG TPA: endonuclease domain-containing protein, partial [Cyclobacteriaceae bacterium]|nr:endonuclease domain-containing protein [Cyclobacteriaceae bacterium]
MRKPETREWQRDKVSDILLSNARELRKNPTESEALLWSFLKNRKLNNLKFRRQQPMEGFILDFYCDEAKLGVEVDGGIHSLKEVAEYDKQRTLFLNEFGIKIIRFSNKEVLKETEKTLTKIKHEASERISGVPSPRPADTPLPGERGRGERTKYYQFKSLLQQDAWLSPAYVGVNEAGIIQYL